jgi:threonine synthase
MRVSGLRCKECKEVYPVGAIYACSTCFGPLEVAYDEQPRDVEAERERILAGPHSLWRYGSFLPLDRAPEGALPAGLTPLICAPRLAEHLGVRRVWVKDDAANPTHSFKDRVVAVALACAVEFGFGDVACASTGNLANAVAAGASALGLRHHVLVPASLEREKLIASDVYGPGLVRVRGDYDQINRLSCELVDEVGWGFVNINLRPFYAEGSRTLAYEVMEQLGFRTPTRVVAPVASGSLYTKIGAGFKEWLGLGMAQGSLPVMHGAQAQGCSPVARAFAGGDEFCDPVRADTSVTSLAIGNPADGPYALRLARESGGSVEAVSDEEACAGVRLLAQTTGVFTEAAGGVSTAVLARLASEERLDPEDEIVLYITGCGLKTPESACGGLILAPEVNASLEAVSSASA